MATAVEDWLMALRLARQLRRPGLAESVGVASEIARCVAAEMACTAGEPHNPVDTRSLCEEMERISGPLMRPSMLLEGQRLRMHMQLEQMYVREDGDWLDVSESAAALLDYLGTMPPPAPRLWNLTAPVFHDLPTASRRLDDYFVALDGLADLVACKDAASDADGHWAQIRPGVLDGMIANDRRGNGLGPVARVIYYEYQSRCRVNAAATMLALHEYHREHARYPDALEELVPDYLPRLLIDYADFAPLRYRRQDEGYLLYGIGEDGADNGGRYGFSWSWRVEGTDAVYSRIEREKFDE